MGIKTEFGLTNAPADCQTPINDVLRNMINQFVFVHVDDIFTKSLETTEPILPSTCIVASIADSIPLQHPPSITWETEDLVKQAPTTGS